MAEVWRWLPQLISENLEFYTDIRSAPGGEWRDSLKDATQFLTLAHTLRTTGAEAMVQAVRANALGEWLVPEWPNATVSASTLAAAATVLPVAVPAAYSVGQQVFVGLDADRWEARVVGSVGGSSITVTAGLAQTYVGTKGRPLIVAPLVRCVAPGGIQFQSTFDVKGLTARFMSIEPVDLAANPYPLHDSIPVVTDGVVPFTPLAGSLNQVGDLMASGFGAYELQEVESFTRRRGTLSWYDKTPAKRWERRGFIHFLRGQDGEFWLPSGQNDLPLQASVSSGALAITVSPATTDAEMIGRVIVIREGASLVTREVTDALTTGDEQELEIAAPGVAFTTAAQVSLAHRSRLEVDTVEITYQWVGAGLAAFCTAPTIEVP